MALNRRTMKTKLGIFLKQYARKRQKGMDPNDRDYDRKLEAALKRLPAQELAALFEEEDEAPDMDGNPSSTE